MAAPEPLSLFGDLDRSAETGPPRPSAHAAPAHGDGLDSGAPQAVEGLHGEVAPIFDDEPGSAEDEELAAQWSALAEAHERAEEVVVEIPDRLVTGLNPAQEEAVRALDGAVLVVAGPGSGKTRVLTHRVAALLATHRAKPWQVLAVTFTNKAAAEMRERIATLVGDEAVDDMWVSTFHSACVRILRANAGAAGLPRSFSIVDATDAKRLISSCMTDLARGNKPEASEVRQAQSTISAVKNSGLSAADLARNHYHQRAWVAPIMAEYDRRLRDMGAVDFDDILGYALRLLQGDERVRERYARRFRYVLVDEFQDTNAVQFEIVRLLASRHANVCAVGDADQSIYAFRAAQPEVINTFVAEWPGASVVVLEQNYRSTKAILEVVRAIIEPNPALHRPKLFTENPDGAPVRLYVADDDRDEAAWVVREIRRSPAGPANHAVLVRTNAQTRSFEDELTRSGIAYSVVGALRFYDRAEVKTALAYLRCAVNPADAISLARCINSPKRGIGDATVGKLLANAAAAGVDPVTAARACVETRAFAKRTTDALAAFLALYDEIAEACEAGPAPALGVVAEQGGMRQMLEQNKDGVDRAENLAELLSAAETFVTEPALTRPDVASVSELPGIEQTLAYLENVALVSSADAGDEEDAPAGRVLLLTAHASKGKEFPHVYVCGVEDGLFPHSRTQDSAAEQAEERRLLFVACSRAQETLTITRARQRMTYGQLSAPAPSPFLDDLPASVVEIAAPTSLVRQSFAQPAHGAFGTRRGPRGGEAYRPVPGSIRPLLAPSQHAAPSAAPGPRLDPGDAVPGAAVVHRAFGQGRIIAASGKTVEVAFATGTKLLDLSLAPMTLAS